MALLDWLSDAIGSLGNASTDPNTMGGVSSAGTPPVAPPTPPTDAQTLANPPMSPSPSAPPLPPSGGGIGSDAARAPDQPPIPPSPPTAAPVTPPGPPMNIAPPAGATAGVDVPSAVKSYQAAGGTFEPPATAPGNGPAARTFLGRALGLDPNSERSMMGGLAAGLTAAGNSAGKSKFQAFASGAGAALGGQEAADDKTEDKQRKYLDQAISAMKAGDQRQTNLALTQLRQAQTKMTLEGKIGKDSVLNSDQQLYLNGLRAVHSDPAVTTSAAGVRSALTQYGPGSKEAQAAIEAHQKLIEDTKQRVLGTLGVSEKALSKIGKEQGMSQDNPFMPKSQADFDKIPEGAYFKNPADGRVLPKILKKQQGQPGQQAAAPGGQTLPAGQGGVPAQAPQPASNLPPLPPSTPTASAIPGLGADEDADEKEPA